MILNQTFELSMILDTDHFRRLFNAKVGYLEELHDEYLDTSLSTKGLTIIYRDSLYKKKVRVIINAGMVVDNLSNTGKLLRKLDKRISEYFDHKYKLDDFTLSGVTLTLDIAIGSRERVFDYLKVLQRVGKVKGFSPVSYNCFDSKASFCLSGNSNAIDFLLYDLEQSLTDQLQDSGMGHKKIKSVSSHTQGILRAEVKLTKPKAVRVYTNAEDTAGQIVELMKDRQQIFLDTFARIVPFGAFYTMTPAVEIVRSEVKDSTMRRKMLRLLTLIPEKRSLHLAQKAANCRDIDKVMEAFARIDLSPVTIAKRHEVKHLENLYSFFL